MTLNRIASTLPTPQIAIAQPQANSVFSNGLILTGTCQTGLPVVLSGAIQANPGVTCAAGAFSAQVIFSNGDGNKTITVSQTNAQNATGLSSRNFVKDSTPPVPTIASPQANAYTPAAVVVAGACEASLTVAISGSITALVNVPCAAGTFSGSVTLSSGDGAKQIRISQTDVAANIGSATVTINLDTTVPLVRIASPNASTMAESGLTIAGSCESGIPVVLNGSGLASTAQVNCVNQQFTHAAIFSPGDGAKQITVRQTDAAGNTSTDTRSFIRGALVLDGRVLYANNCASCHGAVDSSAKRNRTVAQITSAISSVPSMTGLVSLTAAQISAINGVLTDSPGGAPSQFTCDPNELPQSLDANRLTRIEYFNSLQKLLERPLGAAETATVLTTANVMGRLPTDTSTAFSTGDNNFSATHAQIYFDIADAIATAMTSGTRYTRFVNTYIALSPGACTSPNPTSLSAACRDALIRNFVLRAYGRPVEENANNSNNEIAALQSEFTLAASSTAGVDGMIFRVLTSPPFLHHLFVDVSPAGANYRLSSYAIARRAAFALTQAPPDDTLLAMAASSDLLNDATFNQAVDYLAGRMDSTVRQFAREFLRLDRLPTYTSVTHPKFALVTQGLTADENLRTAIGNEAIDLFAYINQANRPASELLTSNISFARNSSLMRIYNVSAAAPANVTETNAVRFPTGERSGLLTRAAVLFSGSHTENTVIRGAHIRSWLLCLNTAAPPANLPAGSLNPPDADPNATTRERYHNKTSGAACISCHSVLNPIGYALSSYNAFGAYQTQEPVFDANGVFVGNLSTNSSTSLAQAVNINQTVNGGVELNQVLSTSDSFRACITRNFYAFATGLNDRPSGNNSCSMNEMNSALIQNRPMQEFYKKAVSGVPYRYRRIN